MNNDQPKCITDRLIETIKMLSESQQAQLMETCKELLKDNRRSPRIEYCTEVVYSDNTAIAHGLTQNVSDTGLFLEPVGPFNVGQEIVMSLAHPIDGRQIKLSGVIIRMDKDGIGIKFDNPIHGMESGDGPKD